MAQVNNVADNYFKTYDSLSNAILEVDLLVSQVADLAVHAVELADTGGDGKKVDTMQAMMKAMVALLAIIGPNIDRIQELALEERRNDPEYAAMQRSLNIDRARKAA